MIATGVLRSALAEVRLRHLSRRVDRAVGQGRLDVALTVARRAADLADRRPVTDTSRQWRGTLHNTVGWIALQLGDLVTAQEEISWSLVIEERIDPRSAQTAMRLSNLAAVATYRGELDLALRHYARALSIGAAVDDASSAYAGDLSSRALVLARLGREEEADEAYEQALAVLERWHPGTPELAAGLTNRATLLLNRGELDVALGLFRRAFDIETGADPQSAESATAWSNLGLVHDALGESGRALDCFLKALRIDEVLAPDAPGTAVDHHNIATVLLAEGRADEAVPHLTEALRIDHFTAPDSAGTAADWMTLGYAHHLAGRLDDAVEAYRTALGIDAAISRTSRDVALDLANLGAAEHQRGRSDDAEHLLRQAEGLFDGLDLPTELARCRTNLAAVLHDTGRRDDAIACARTACAAAERARGRAGQETSREQVFALQQSPFAALITWLHDRGADGDADEAFVVAEAASARSLADLLAERRRRWVDGPWPAELDPGRRVDPARAMAELPGTLVLRYTEGNDRLHMWAGRDGRSALLPVHADADGIAESVERAVGAYRRGDRGGPAEREAQQELARILLDPLPDELWDGVGRILVIPVGSLFLLPFELLPRGAGVLGDEVEISYAPSVSVLLRGLAAERSVPGLAPFIGYAGGDDAVPLPGAVREVRQVGEVLGAGSAAVRLRPTRQTVASTIGGARYVHFATHGVLDDTNPLRSGLVCAPDGRDEDPVLRADEIMELQLHADLVVCSACRTGLGRLRRGEGVLGLSRAFLLAGAQSLVLTLWPVPDIPTRRLMVAFAEQVGAGLAPAAALAAARRAVRMRHPATFRSPWTWAGFILIGRPAAAALDAGPPGGEADATTVTVTARSRSADRPVPWPKPPPAPSCADAVRSAPTTMPGPRSS